MQIEHIALYTTRCIDRPEVVLLEEDAVLIFTSPSTVACFLKHYAFLPTQRVVAIGSTTAAALPLHVRPELPKSPSIQACVALAQSLA